MIVEFRTDDPAEAKILRLLDEMPTYTAARAECEAHLYLALARVAWRDADRFRALETKRGTA